MNGYRWHTVAKKNKKNFYRRLNHHKSTASIKHNKQLDK